tara:strand:+ start:2576 stop:3073 length:498 start_codon:yes stop_codon:yes gene_type:complete
MNPPNSKENMPTPIGATEEQHAADAPEQDEYAGGDTIQLTNAKLDAAAIACHEMNKTYCAAFMDFDHEHWDDCPEALQNSARDGIIAICMNPAITPPELHNNWMMGKAAEGYVWGPTKSVVDKTHPSLIEYNELTYQERMKDLIFLSTARAVLVRDGVLKESHFF